MEGNWLTYAEAAERLNATPEAVRQKETFVWIDNERVCQLEPSELRLPFFRQNEKTAVCRVDVVPKAMAFRDRADLRQRIDRTDIRRSCGGNDEEWIQAREFVLFDLLLESRCVDAKHVVERDKAKYALTQTRDANAFVDRMMSLF